MNLKLNSPLVVFLIVLIFSGLLSLIIAITSVEIGIAFLLMIVGAPFLILSIVNSRIGLILIIIMSCIIFTVIRIKPNIPFGLLMDSVVLATLLGVLYKVFTNKSDPQGFFNSRVNIVYVVWVAYQLFQVFNPNLGNVGGWIAGLRPLMIGVCFYVITYYTLQGLSFIKIFTKVWLGLALFIALYALKQEYFGLADWELSWINSNPKVLGLSTVGGRFRRWSILADVSSFGMFMAFSSIACFILLLGPFKTVTKMVLGISGTIMIYSMVFSFTRTAYAMVPIGLALYFLLNLNNRKTLVFAIICFTAFITLMFGPFYSGPINRIRSTFQPSQDASYNVRDLNRARIQPYIQSNPFGGGTNTTGVPGETFNPGHALAGFPPDNGYLRIALEYGYVGLFIYLTLFFTTMAVGIKGFYTTKNMTVKVLYSTYLCCFFALSIANFAQVAQGQPPMGLIFGAFYALSFRLNQIQ